MPKRRFHTDSRAGENFTKDGLETLTGQPSRKWGRYVVKELVDILQMHLSDFEGGRRE